VAVLLLSTVLQAWDFVMKILHFCHDMFLPVAIPLLDALSTDLLLITPYLPLL
jgi:hypothetical protein